LEVNKKLGSGFLEAVYQEALEIELAYKVGIKSMPVYKFPIDRQIFHRKI
jgi:hypothetical protein